jgi:ribosomal protein S18 acetylase RimI-like enzyme
MLIRSAAITDIPAILPMVANICALHESWDSAKYGFITNPQQRYEQWLQGLVTGERSILLVAEAEKKLVGFLAATVEREIPIYRLEEFAFIHDLWVDEEYRQQGAAKQMVMQAVEKFENLGVKQIRLDTAAINEAARQLFASCGFRLSTMEMLIELG